ncbi:hypothetical protein ACFL6I_03415 [candidate division KSB1 bacterium]
MRMCNNSIIKLSCIFLFVSIFVLSCACGTEHGFIPPTEPEEGAELIPGSIQGHVLESDSFKPLPGVVVSVGDIIDTTSLDGYFELPDVPPGNQTIHAVRGCYNDPSYYISASMVI